MAVSKKKDAGLVRAAIDAGQTVFGENYMQEARQKVEEIGPDIARWHFIGHLQSNKAKYAARLFDTVETVDDIGLARELDRRAKAAGRTLDVLVQVNVGRELQKSGADVEKTEALLREMAPLEALRVRGLMTMPPLLPPEEVRPYFRNLRGLRDRLREQETPGIGLDDLSMGMTGDFEVAIEEGATIVRIGTAIFGPR